MLELAQEEVQLARQDYIDGLPIAAAVLCQSEGGESYIDLANGLFAATVGWNGQGGTCRVDDIDFFAASGIGAALADFLASGERAFQFEGKDGRSIDGRYYIVRLARLRPTPFAPQRCLLSLIDTTAQIETEKNLRAEMLRDSLSGLPNRVAFTERLEAILAGPEYRDDGHAILVADMARFSRVNECAGSLAGDELLISVARRLCSALRPGDVLARIGGDEFGILLRLDKGADDALRFAERVKEVLTAPFRLSGLEIHVDCAIGGALVSGRPNMAEEILRNAQLALNRSKGSGRAELYRIGEAQAARRRFTLETELRRAIEGDRLGLVFQPLIEFGSGRIAGFEALARWDHEEEGAIAPDEFIAVAEESGLIVPLGRWALGAALDALAGWDAKAGTALPFYMSVNLSAVQLRRDDVPQMVASALASRAIPGRRLMLELTESAIVHDPELAGAVLRAMKALEVGIALDDFGSGFTSMAYLQRLPIDLLKIDASFVTGMADDPDATSIVRAILSLAGALGFATTAEGVESDELARMLARLGCTNGQGFFLGEPLAAEAAFDYWRSRNA